MGSSLILVLVSVFLVINLVVGIWAGRGVTTVEDYAIGKRKWGVSSLVMTFLATTLDAGALFREASTYVTIGIIVFLHFCSISISHFIRSIFLANQVSRFRDCLSIGDFIFKLYGNGARLLIGALSTIYGCLCVALQLKGLSIIFSVFTGIDSFYATLISGIIIAVYTALGGMRAVVATDILQFVMIFCTLLIIAAFSIYKAGGMLNVIEQTPSSIMSLFGNDSKKIFWSLILLEVVFSYELAEPARFQRALMAKSSSTFRKLFIYSGIGNFLGFGLIFISTLAVVAILGEGIGDTSPIIYIVNNLVPEYFKPIILVGCCAIVFSSGDSWLHSAGVSFMRDFVEPVAKKSKSLNFLKWSIFSIGLLSIVVAYKGEIIYSNLGNLLAVTAPIVSVPVFLGFLGMKTSSRMFWSSAISAMVSFLAVKLIFVSKAPYGIVISCFCSLVAYLSTHFYENGKIVMVGNPIFSTSHRKSFFGSRIADFLSEFRSRVDAQGMSLALFGGVYIAMLVLPYIFSFSENQEYTSQLFYLRAIGVVLCGLLITSNIWGRNLRKILPVFWYLTLSYCLPFLSLLFVIVNGGAAEYMMTVSASTVVLFLLVNWLDGLVIFALGSVAAILYSLTLNPFLDLSTGTTYLLIVQLIATLFLSCMMARKRNKFAARASAKSKILEIIQNSTIDSTQRSMNVLSRETSQLNSLLAPPSMKDLINKLAKKYSSNTDLQADFLQLADALEGEELTRIYRVLNAKRYNTYDLAHQCEEAMKAAGCEDVAVDIYTNKERMRCEEAAMLKMCYTIATDFCRKVYLENSGADTDLSIAFFDTKISYESEEDGGSEKLFTRTIDGICILISEREFDRANELVKDLYTKRLTDLEAISPSTVDDVSLLDIAKSIDAHYGTIENLSSKDFLIWKCVIPADVYEIRPETLDLSEPISFKYNWPAALELEKEFIDQLTKNYSDMNLHKVDYALYVIKKYHYHQTRKSGEPYYMHPINVAKLLLTIISEEKTEIHKQLLDNKESLLLAALLHDVLEDTSYTKAALTRNFGTKIRDIVLTVTKINYSRRAVLLSNKQAFQDLIDKEPLSLCVKLADRLHNLMTLDGHPSVEKRKKVAQETLDFFVRPAEKYGLEKLAKQLREGAEWVLRYGKVYGYEF